MLAFELTPSPWYWFAAAAHALLLGYVLLAAGRGLLRWQLLAVALAGTAWGSFHATVPGGTALPLDPAGFVVEIAYLGAWFLLLHRVLRGPYDQSMPDLVRRVLVLLWLLLAAIGALSAWGWYARSDRAFATTGLDAAVLIAALLCLALAAQLHRDAPLEGRRALLRLVTAGALAAGTQAYANGVAFLTGGAPAALLALEAVLAGTAALLLLGAVSLRPQWSLAIFVSPQARSYSPRFILVAVVLAAMLVAMPYSRTLPQAFAQMLTVAMVPLGALPVLALLFSQRLGGLARVWLSKHLRSYRYNYRTEWLRLIATLSSPDPRLPLPERAIKSVAQIVNSPAGLLWLRRDPDGVLGCSAGWNTKMWSDARVRLDDPTIAFMAEKQWIFDTAELARNPAMYNGLARPKWLDQFPDALLLVPLFSNETLIGFMLLLQSSSAFRLTFEEIDLLRTTGRQVAAHLAQYEADQRLAEAKQFEAFNRLTAFLMHDLKNLIAQQSLVVKNAARHKGNPDFFEDTIATIENSVARMSKLLQQLQSGETSGRRTRLRLGAALQEAVERCRGGVPEPRLEEVDERLCAQLDRERFAMVTAHLIRNAQDATGAAGHVAVRVRREGSQAVITIEDDGCGMDAEFIRTRLFRPFDTTKGSKGMGIGAYQARTFVVDSGGSLEVQSEPGSGTCITIRLPLAEPAETVAEGGTT
ncbi:MAG: PEP-CTERM system histidine kinase PrsK [Gammaproteobacteria bacterium]|nr:PEP-CTERM system histidine kinase PrsK [Gammaproteobacteria bacterium]